MRSIEAPAAAGPLVVDASAAAKIAAAGPPPAGGLTAPRLATIWRLLPPQLAESAVQSAVHLVVIQPPTSPIVVITATSMIPSKTVYSTRAAPSSSRANFFI